MLKSKYMIIWLLIAMLLPLMGIAKADKDEWDVDIPFKKYVLDNGLTLIVHEDHKAPIVAVNIWYHVGSKNEKPGKTGFAHLFEHLMFNGSEHFNDDYFQALERLGATDLNGTTNRDRTNYFQNVPKNALDVVLWLESDRMGHLLGAIDQAKLDEQRGVVQNEKRQGENRPYGRVRYVLAENTYPKGHPYSWTTIGSMEDLNAASLEDVYEWFKKYYGAANATLVIAGDVNAEEVKQKVEKYFGDIPSGPPVERQKVWIAKMQGEHRYQMQDRVPQARLYKVWNIPEWGSQEYAYLDLVSDLLSSGKTSRLYKRLVYQDQIASSVWAYIMPGEIGSQFMIVASAQPGVSLKQIEAAIDEELQRFLNEGPTEEELTRVKTDYLANFIRGIERIGGFGGKSDILAMNQVFAGSPDHYKTYLQYIKNASPQVIRRTARKWLEDGVFVLEVTPFPKYKTQPSDVDRSKMPEAGTPPKPDFPDLQRATLSNGLKIVLAERHTIPMVQMSLMVNAGYKTDTQSLPGVANLAMNMLDEGTKRYSALEISEKLNLLGAQLYTSSDLDYSYVFLSSLKSRLKEALDIYADVILNPQFPQKDFERLKKQTLTAIKREKAQPTTMALRVLPVLIYGKGHPYALPFTGSGYEETVEKIEIAHLKEFHRKYFKPNNATLVVVGDITLPELKALLEKKFRKWKAGEVPELNVPMTENHSSGKVFIIDRPGAVQSVIFSGDLFPPKNSPDDLAIYMMNKILGGTFTSRINMNLREEKHWSYGARSIIAGTQAQRPFIVLAPVQTDKTAESVQEIRNEIEGIRTTEPPTADELNKVKKNEILRLPGQWETMNAVLGSITNIVRYNLPDTYYDQYPAKVEQISLDMVKQVAQKYVHPEKLVWVIVGDRSKITEPVKSLNIGEIQFIDSDGNPVE